MITCEPHMIHQVGNQAFADYIDANVSFTHINNKEDIVPIVPGISSRMFLMA
jgi:hypothetical protein